MAAGTIPVDEIEWLAVIQHFGGPTRLLDWTRSPFVALYFAIADATAPQGAAAVWAVDGEWCRKQAQAVFETDGAIPKDWSERVVGGMYLVPELFQSLILSNRFSTVIPIEPFRRNERLVIQQGLFLCPGKITVPFVENLKTSPDDDKARIVKLRVPNAQRAHGLSELREMNISEATLFPGLDGFSRSLRHLIVGESDEQLRRRIMLETLRSSGKREELLRLASEPKNPGPPKV